MSGELEHPRPSVDEGFNLWELNPAELAEFEEDFVFDDLRRLRNKLDAVVFNALKLVDAKIHDSNLHYIFNGRILESALAYDQASTISETELGNLGAYYASFLRKLLPYGAQLQGARAIASLSTMTERFKLSALTPAEVASGLQPFDQNLLQLGLGKEVVLPFRNTTLEKVVHPTSMQTGERESQLRFVIEGLMLASGKCPELHQAVYQENQHGPFAGYESLSSFYEYQLAKLIELLTFLNKTYVDSIIIFSRDLEQRKKAAVGAEKSKYEMLGKTLAEISATIKQLQSIHASMRNALLSPRGAKLQQRRDFEMVVKIMKPYLFGSDTTRFALIDNLEPAGTFNWIEFYRTALKHAEAGIEPDFYKQLAATINMYLTNRYKDAVAPPVYTQNKLSELIPIERIDETKASPINWDKLIETVREAQQLGLPVIHGNVNFTPVHSPLRPEHVTLLLSRVHRDLVRVAISFPSGPQTIITPTIHLDLDLKKRSVDWDALYAPDTAEYIGVLNAFTDYLQLSLNIPLSTEGKLYLEEVSPSNNEPTVAVEEVFTRELEETATSNNQTEADGKAEAVERLIENFQPVLVPRGEERRYKKTIVISEATALEDIPWDYPFSLVQKQLIFELIMESNSETDPAIERIRGKKGFYRLKIPSNVPGLNNGVRVILRKSEEGYLIHKVRVRNEQTYDDL